MTTSPSFQFYPKDWLSSTKHLSLAAQGAYITLLAWSWDNGPLPKSLDRRARVIGMSPKKFQKLWREVSEKWVETETGFVNSRQERQRVELQEHRRKLSEAGKRGAAALWQGHRPRHGEAIGEANGEAYGPSMALPSSYFDLHKDQDQDQRSAPLALREVREHLRAALHRKLNDEPDLPDGDLADYVKSLGRPLGFTWNTGNEITKLIDSVRGQREKGGQR